MLGPACQLDHGKDGVIKVVSYPGAIWPGQIADALRGLIHAANQARGKGLTAVPGKVTAPLIHRFRHGVLGRAVTDPPPPLGLY